MKKERKAKQRKEKERKEKRKKGKIKKGKKEKEKKRKKRKEKKPPVNYLAEGHGMRRDYEAKENDARKVHGAFPLHFHHLYPYYYLITRYACHLGLIRYTRTTAVMITSWGRCHQ